MRVLTCLNSLGLGGIEVTLLRCLPYLQSAGIELGIACSAGPNDLDEEFLAQGVDIYRVARPERPGKLALQIERIVRNNEFDLVHSRFGYSSAGIVLGAALSGVPAVVSIHNSRPRVEILGYGTGPIVRGALLAWLGINRIALHGFGAVVVGHSEANLDAFEPDWRRFPRRFGLVLNGVRFPLSSGGTPDDYRDSIGVPAGSPVFLHVGSFKTEKNHRTLLRIFQGILCRLPDAYLVLVGDGFLKGQIEEDVDELGLRENVLLVGRTRDPWVHYLGADVLIFPSIAEGYGNVLVEAQAVGLPIVASDIPAHREAVERSQHRFLFSLDESEKAVQLAIDQYEAAREGRNWWVNHSRDVVSKRNSIQSMADSLVQVYSSVLATGGLEGSRAGGGLGVAGG